MTSMGCAAAPQEEAAWPQKPSPSYPTARREAKADHTPSVAPRSNDRAPDNSEPSSALAKQYDGKAALDVLEGKATYYADSLAGNHTANGDVYDPGAFTAAHKKLPFGTIVRVVRTDTKATTYVRINDRGPFGPAERIIDLSKAAARKLDMLRAGVIPVRVEVVQRPKKKK